jgi:hypothetical protein
MLPVAHPKLSRTTVPVGRSARVPGWPEALTGTFLIGKFAMIVIYFCLDDAAPVMRYWPIVPRAGDVISLPELGGNLNPLKVDCVLWEAHEEPTVTVFLHRSRDARDGIAGYCEETESDARKML